MQIFKIMSTYLLPLFIICCLLKIIIADIISPMLQDCTAYDVNVKGTGLKQLKKLLHMEFYQPAAFRDTETEVSAVLVLS